MDSENFAFLQETLKYLGFGGKLFFSDQFDQKVAGEPKEFQVSTDVFFDEEHRLDCTLHFRRSEQLNMYFFNKYEAKLDDGKGEDKERVQTFYISKGSGVTLKEAYNLLLGRAVNKDLTNAEGQKYNAWIQLNFGEKDLNNNYKVRQFRQQYGYDLEKTLEKYPILELKNDELRAGLIRSLKKGNMHTVSFEKKDRIEKMFIEASPQYKTINIYPTGTKIIRREVAKQAQAAEQAVVQDPLREGDKESPKETKEEEIEGPVRRTARKAVMKG